MWKQLKQLAKHSMIYGLGNVAASLFSLFLVPLYTNYLTPAQFGKYALIMILFNLFSLVLDLGIVNSLARFYFDEGMEADQDALAQYRQRLISTCLTLSALTSIGVAAIFYFTAPWLARQLLLEADGIYYLRLIAATLPFHGLTIAPIMYLRLTERPATYVVLSSIQIALFFLLNIFFVSVLKIGVVGIFYSLLISTSIYSVMLVAAAWRVVKPGIDRAMAIQLLKFGVPFLPMWLLMWVVDLSDRYLVGIYTTANEVGIYSLGYKFGQVMSFVVTAFSLGWVPIRFKILSLAEPKIVYGRVTTFYLAGAGMVWLALSLFSRELIVMTSAESFHAAAAYIPPVGFAYLVYGLFVLSVTGLGVTKRTVSLPFIVFVAAVLNVALNILLIPRMGAIAAAYTTLFAYAVMVTGSLYFSQRHYPIAYEYQKCLWLIAGMVVLAALAPLLSSLPLILNIVAKLLILCVYFPVILAVRVFKKSEIVKGIQVISGRSPLPISACLNSLLGHRYLRQRTAEGEVI